MVDEAQVFLEECPASPIGHILALRSHLEGVGESMPYISMDSLNNVTIYLTHACNLRCIHCYLSAGEPLGNELNVRDWLIILDKLRELGVRFVYLLGGEPMLLVRRGLFDIIRHAKDLGIYVSMSTNGTLVTRDVAVKLKEAGLDQVQVSVDGPNPAINDVIRGIGSFDLAMRAINILKDVGIGVSLSYTVMSSNAYYIVDMVRLAEKLGIPVLTFIRVQEFGRAYDNGIGLSDDDAERVLYELLSIKANVKLVLNGFRFYLKNLRKTYEEIKGRLSDLGITNYTTCPAGKSRFVIDSNGDIYGCELLMSEEFKEGNALRDDIRHVWRDEFKVFRNRKYTEINQCSKCPMADLCNAGCPARAYRAYGSINAPDPYCPLAKRSRKI